MLGIKRDLGRHFLIRDSVNTKIKCLYGLLVLNIEEKKRFCVSNVGKPTNLFLGIYKKGITV